MTLFYKINPFGPSAGHIPRLFINFFIFFIGGGGGLTHKEFGVSRVDCVSTDPSLIALISVQRSRLTLTERIDRTAALASSLVSATITPFPAANPLAFTTKQS